MSKRAAGAVCAALALLTTAYVPAINGLRHNRLVLAAPVAIGASAIGAWQYTRSGAALIACVALSVFLFPAPGIRIFLLALAAVAFVLACASHEKWAGGMAYIADTVCIVALANVAMEILQVAGLGIPGHTRGITGLMANPDETSALLGICAPYFFRRRWVLALPLVVLGIVLCKVWIGLVALVAVAGVLLWKRHGIVGASIATAGGVCTLAAVGGLAGWSFEAHVGSRLVAWSATVQAWLSFPVLGWGFGRYGAVIPSLLPPGTEMFMEAHNDFLQLAFSTGALGLILAAAFVASTIKKGLRLVDTAPVLSFIASCVSACAFFTWQIVPLAALTIFSLAAIHGAPKSVGARR
jgi:O-antigen ligase